MSSAIPNIFGTSWKISSILHWNMLPAGDTLDSSLAYLYLPNWHERVRFNDFLSSFRFPNPDLASTGVRGCVFVNVMNIQLTVWSLYTD